MSRDSFTQFKPQCLIFWGFKFRLRQLYFYYFYIICGETVGKWRIRMWRGRALDIEGLMELLLVAENCMTCGADYDADIRIKSL
jgi:predicted small integral membrane protein